MAETSQTPSDESLALDPLDEMRLQIAALEGWAANSVLAPEVRLRAAFQALALWRKLYPDPDED